LANQSYKKRSTLGAVGVSADFVGEVIVYRGLIIRRRSGSIGGLEDPAE
jgi:hypothetical protein